MKKDRLVLIPALIGLLLFGFYKWVPSGGRTVKDRDLVRASETMARATGALSGCEIPKNVVIDPRADLNRTGWIGRESSPITTSLGNLEAKRTSTNPNFGGLVALLLRQAGVKRGDAVAIGASSSFPALVVASLCAVEALEAKPVVICSLGASNWGGNKPEFSLLEMLQCLRENGILDVRPIALAVGGERDDGSDMSGEGRAFLAEKIERTGIFFLREPDLAANVRQRMSLYSEKAGPGGIKAFINVGGSWANMGTDSAILKLKPGLTDVEDIPALGKRGVIQEMASRKIPVIHLLYVKGLADRYGLPWDPVPLPGPGEGRLFLDSAKSGRPEILLVGIYIGLLLASIALVSRKLPFVSRS